MRSEIAGPSPAQRAEMDSALHPVAVESTSVSACNSCRIVPAIFVIGNSRGVLGTGAKSHMLCTDRRAWSLDPEVPTSFLVDSAANKLHPLSLGGIL